RRSPNSLRTLLRAALSSPEPAAGCRKAPEQSDRPQEPAASIRLPHRLRQIRSLSRLQERMSAPLRPKVTEWLQCWPRPGHPAPPPQTDRESASAPLRITAEITDC